jgi:hypothetical protein
MGIMVNLIDFNTEDGIRSKAFECDLCFETLETDFTGIPVISGSYGLVRVCRACWACGYVAVNVDKLEEAVKEHETVEVVEIHSGGEYAAGGYVIANTTKDNQVWAIGTVQGEVKKAFITDVTDESI